MDRLDLSLTSELSATTSCPGPKKSRTEEEGTDGDWQSLLESSHHQQVAKFESSLAPETCKIEKW